MESDDLKRIIVWGATLIFVLLEIYSLTTDSHYKNDFFFLLGGLWIVYHYGKKLRLHWSHFLLFGLFLIVHNLGTFGLYSNFYLGMEYDWYVHTFFGLSAGLILFRAFRLDEGVKGRWHLVWMVPALALGLSAMHEVFIEFAGALLLGKGEGMLYIGAGDVDTWDTHKDLFFNFLGAVLGLGVSGIKRILAKT
jgi:uncharacterized membrane protein YjdF